MTTTSSRREQRAGILSSGYAATTIGTFAMIAFVAFEAMAVTTVMPTVARDLGGFDLYALAFAAPFASGVVGMVAAGMWSDRRGPTLALFASMASFSLGLLVCGIAPSMEVLVVGRVLQGLGGGAVIVSAYVLVGLIYPARLQPSVFASFAAAWVLPSLFGPWTAALVAEAVGWRWVFAGMVVLVAGAALLVMPAVRTLSPPTPGDSPVSLAPLGWALLAAVAVMALELLGSARGVTALGALVALVTMFVALRRLLPGGTLVARRGLPAIIGLRGLLSASFLSTEAHIVYALQDMWGLTPTRAGIALTIVGVAWAAASQAQSLLRDRVSDVLALQIGAALVLVGVCAVTAVVTLRALGGDVTAVAPVAGYVLASLGMGFAYPRTGVSTLAASTDSDRGFNSSALQISDSLGAALALSLSGIAYAAAQRAGVDAFVVVFLISSGIGVLGVAAALRARAAGRPAR